MSAIAEIAIRRPSGDHAAPWTSLIPAGVMSRAPDPCGEATKRRPKGGLLPPSGRSYSSWPFRASGAALATDAARAISDTTSSPRRSRKL